MYGLNKYLIDINIETLAGTTFTLKVSLLESIQSLKAKIQRHEGVPISHQHLVWQSVELDDNCCLNDYNIQNGATIRMVLALRGGPINTRRMTTEDTLLHDVSDLMGEIQEDSNLWSNNNNNPNNNDSSSHSINKHVTLLLFRDGDHLNLLRVIDRGDATSPISGAMSAASMYVPYDETDHETLLNNNNTSNQAAASSTNLADDGLTATTSSAKAEVASKSNKTTKVASSSMSKNKSKSSNLTTNTSNNHNNNNTAVATTSENQKTKEKMQEIRNKMKQNKRAVLLKQQQKQLQQQLEATSGDNSNKATTQLLQAQPQTQPQPQPPPMPPHTTSNDNLNKTDNGTNNSNASKINNIRIKRYQLIAAATAAAAANNGNIVGHPTASERKSLNNMNKKLIKKQLQMIQQKNPNSTNTDENYIGGGDDYYDYEYYDDEANSNGGVRATSNRVVEDDDGEDDEENEEDDDDDEDIDDEDGVEVEDDEYDDEEEDEDEEDDEDVVCDDEDLAEDDDDDDEAVGEDDESDDYYGQDDDDEDVEDYDYDDDDVVVLVDDENNLTLGVKNYNHIDVLAAANAANLMLKHQQQQLKQQLSNGNTRLDEDNGSPMLDGATDAGNRAGVRQKEEDDEEELNSSELTPFMMMRLNSDQLSLSQHNQRGLTSSSLATTALPTIITPMYVTSDGENLNFAIPLSKSSANKLKYGKKRKGARIAKVNKNDANNISNDGAVTDDATTNQVINKSKKNKSKSLANKMMLMKSKSILNTSNPDAANEIDNQQVEVNETNNESINAATKLAKQRRRRRNQQQLLLAQQQLANGETNGEDLQSDASNLMKVKSTKLTKTPTTLIMSSTLPSVNPNSKRNMNKNSLNNILTRQKESLSSSSSHYKAYLIKDATNYLIQRQLNSGNNSNLVAANENADAKSTNNENEPLTNATSSAQPPKPSVRSSINKEPSLLSNQKRVSFTVNNDDPSKPQQHTIQTEMQHNNNNPKAENQPQSQSLKPQPLPQAQVPQQLQQPSSQELPSNSTTTTTQLKPLIMTNYKQKPLPKLGSLYNNSSNEPSQGTLSSSTTNGILPALNKLDLYKNTSLLQSYNSNSINANHHGHLQNHTNNNYDSRANGQVEITRLYSASKMNKNLSMSTNDVSLNTSSSSTNKSTFKLPPVVVNNNNNNSNSNSTSSSILLGGSNNNLNSIGIHHASINNSNANDLLVGSSNTTNASNANQSNTTSKKKITDLSRYCYFCHRKTGLASSYICRCGNNYCTQHRNAEAHNCTFDYKTEGRKLIEHSNPLVAAPKLPKI